MTKTCNEIEDMTRQVAWLMYEVLVFDLKVRLDRLDQTSIDWSVPVLEFGQSYPRTIANLFPWLHRKMFSRMAEKSL